MKSTWKAAFAVLIMMTSMAWAQDAAAQPSASSALANSSSDKSTDTATSASPTSVGGPVCHRA